jgi:hypothetical protein
VTATRSPRRPAFIEIAADDRGSFRFIAVEVPSTLGTYTAEVAQR